MKQECNTSTQIRCKTKHGDSSLGARQNYTKKRLRISSLTAWIKIEETLPTSIKEKETHWHRRAVSLLHHKAAKKKKPMGIWRVSGSIRLQNIAERSIVVFISTPSGNKLMGILNQMGMEYLSKFMGLLMVQSKLFKLVQ
eukprot:218014-Pelagomonas_calceolata.AAC.1